MGSRSFGEILLFTRTPGAGVPVRARFGPLVRGFAVALAVGVGCQESSVTKFNNNPEASIRNPSGGAELARGQVFSATGVVDDDDHATEDLIASWYIDGELVCEGTVASDGDTQCDMSIDSAEGVILLEVQDPMGAVGEDRVDVTTINNNRPVIGLESPSTDLVYYRDQKVHLLGSVSDLEDPPGSLILTAESDVNGPWDVTLHEDGTFTGSMFLDEAEHSITIQAEDSHGGVTTEVVFITVGGSNSNPSCNIVSPADGSAVDFRETVEIVGQISDPDVGPELLNLTWVSSLEGIISDGPPDPTGSAYVFLEPGSLSLATHVITLQGEDEVGGVCSDVILLTVGEPPEIALEEPIDGGVYGFGEPLTIRATVSDAEDSASDIALEWTTLDDGVFSTQGADSTGTVEFAVDSLLPGTKSMTVTATDVGGLFTTAMVNFTINEKASAPEVQIITTDGGDCVDSDVFTGDEMRACVAVPAEDPDGDAITYTYTWYRDGLVMEGYEDVSMPASESERGQMWRVDVTPWDSLGPGYTGQDTVTIRNTPPVVVDAIVNPDPARTEDDLFCTLGLTVDPDGDETTYEYSWTVNGISTSETSGVLGPEHFGKSDEVSCIVTPSDAIDAGEPTTSIPRVISNSPPSVDAVSIVPEDVSTGDILTCSYSGFSDPDGDAEPDESIFTWFLNGEEVATGSAFVSEYIGGDVISCEVTPSDGEDAGPTASASVTVYNTSPTISGVSIDPGTPRSDSALTCDWTGWADADGDDDASIARWSVNGVEVGSGTTLSGMFTGGDLVTCTVTAFDGRAEGTVLATSVIIGNTAPSALGATISPNPATVGVPLTCSADGFSDPDSGDSDHSMFEWRVNTEVVGSSAVLDSGFVGGDDVSCELTPFDGSHAGLAVTSEMTITNTLPTVAWVAVGPEEVFADTPVNCAWDPATDADGHSLLVTAEWTINGDVAGFGTALDSGYGAGDEVACNVYANDGFDDGPRTTASVIVQNTMATIDDVAIIPNPARASDTLVCDWTGYTDIDGDPDASVATWAVNGLFAGVGPELHGGFYGGQTVSCTVIPSDGRDSGDAMLATIVVTNSAPTIDSAAISPDTATVGTDLTCSYDGYDDLDFDADASTYAWTINGAPAGSGPVLSGGFVGLDLIECIVTPDDGEDAGEPVVATFEVVNTAPSVVSVAIDPVAPQTGDTVTCSWDGYEDADGHADASYVEWTINGEAALTAASITGGFTSGDELACRVVPFDGADMGSPVSQAVTIQNAAPSIGSVVVNPPTATAETYLTCNWSGYLDLEGEDDVSEVEWFINGVAAGTGDMLLSGYVHGDVVSCEVTPYDGVDYGDSVSGSLDVANTAPSVGEVTITPDPAYRTNELTCTWAGYNDADGEVDQSFATWIVEGEEVHTGPTLLANSAHEGDIVRCEVQAYDGTDEGNMSTNYVTIQDSVPQIDSVTIIPEPAQRDSILQCLWLGFYDADGDPDASTVIWTMDGTVVSTETEVEGFFEPGDELGCTVTPSDGEHSGSPVSASVVIQNAPPVVSSAALTPDPAYAGDTLTCSEGYTSDADGTTLFLYQYRWRVNDVIVTGATSNTLASAYFEKNDSVQCSVAANDGMDTGDYTSSNIVGVLNSEPQIVSAALVPSIPQTDDTLSMSVVSTDGDGDVVNTDVDWYVNGELVSSLPTLSGSFYFNKGDQIFVELTPNDGEDDGDTVVTSPTTVINTPPTSPTVSVSPVDPVTGIDDIVCSLTGFASDADGDPLTYSIGWLRDGVEWSGPVSTTAVGDDTILGSSLKSYETWTCQIFAIDDEEAGLPGTAEASVQSIFEGWGSVHVGLGESDVFFEGEDNKDYSGRGVGWAGDTDGDGTSDILIAAPDNDDAYSSAGKVYLVRSADVPGVSTVPLNDVGIAWTGMGSGFNLGGYVQSESLSTAGDIDGDGLDDFMIGEPLYEGSSGTPNGRVYLIKGASVTSTGPVSIPSIDVADIIFEGPTYGQLGHAVRNVGDVNGLGLPDILMGASNASGGRGEAYLFYGEDLGSGSSFDAEVDAAVEFTAESPGDELGLRVGTSGDVDGDGLTDILVAAPSNDIGSESRAGRVYLMLSTSLTGTSHPMGVDSDWLFNGGNSNDLAGHSLDMVGDIDKDGYAEFMIAAKGDDSYGSNSGMVYVMNGAELPIFRTVALGDAWYKIGGETAGDRAGHDVSFAGDVDSDGRGDMLISAYANDAGGPSSGRTYLVLGAGLDLSGGSIGLEEADYAFTGESSADSSGYSIAGNGDWDGDGLSDFLIGAYLNDSSVTDAGTTYLFIAPSIYH